MKERINYDKTQAAGNQKISNQHVISFQVNVTNHNVIPLLILKVKNLQDADMDMEL